MQQYKTKIQIITNLGVVVAIDKYNSICSHEIETNTACACAEEEHKGVVVCEPVDGRKPFLASHRAIQSLIGVPFIAQVVLLSSHT